MSYGADQDEELAELQRRFMALEDEARTTMEKTMATPRGAANKAGRERAALASVRADNEAELAKLDEQITQSSLKGRNDDVEFVRLRPGEREQTGRSRAGNCRYSLASRRASSASCCHSCT